MKGRLNKKVAMEECPWLKDLFGFDLEAGTTVFRYPFYTYGCITPTGVAVTFELRKPPFFEVPRNAVDWEKDNG